MKTYSKPLIAAGIVGLTLAAGSAQSDVLAVYTLNTTNELTATSVNPNLSASAFGIRQSEDPNGGTLNDDTYQFTAGGLLINRSTVAANGWDFGTNVAAPFSFTIFADNGIDIQVDSVTVVAGSSTHNLAYRFGTSETTLGYTASHTFSTGGGTDTRTLASPFIIAAGGSKTFFIDLNSANGNSNHNFSSITVNGIPEPGSLALMGIGGLLIARRRRD